MNYKEAIDYIHSTEKFGSVLGLDTIGYLMGLLGNPQDELKVIHVAGTNGKGSVCTMLAEILKKSGYKTGLYTSPYLERFNERIKIDGRDIRNEEIAKYTKIVKEKAVQMTEDGKPHPTEFEFITAMAFLYYRDMKCDVVVLEVGMGGRLDATNIVKKPELEIITSIGFDHVEYLGNTLSEIAYEKAGIIKPDTTVVSYPSDEEALDTIRKVCDERNARFILADEKDIVLLKTDIDGSSLEYLKENPAGLRKFRLSLIGKHQSKNVLTVLNAVDELIKTGYSITVENIKKALANVVFTGRFEVLRRNPLIIIDGGHNIDGIKSFAENIKLCFGDEKINLFYGMLRDKDYMNSIEILTSLAKRIHTLTPDSPRALTSDELRMIIKEKHEEIPIDSLSDYSQVIDRIKKDEVNAFVGSLYMIGKIRTLINSNIK